LLTAIVKVWPVVPAVTLSSAKVFVMWRTTVSVTFV